MIGEYLAKVVENKKLTEFVFETCLELTKPMEWEVGQYVSIQTPAPRSYSICSMPEDKNHINICVDVKPGGMGSNYIKNLRAGDAVTFKGPLGKFLLEVKKSDYVFVATGTGIGPFKAMIPVLLEETRDKKQETKIVLFWGLRHRSEVYYQDFFENLKQKYPNFNFQIVFSEDGHHVTEFVKTQKSTEYYLCGNMEMIRKLSAKLPNAHFESYY